MYDWAMEYRPYDQDDTASASSGILITQHLSDEPVEVLPLSERYLPSVSFDLDIRKRLGNEQQIDFNYDEYFKLAESLGMSEDQAAAVNIQVAARVHNVPLVNGYFSRSQNLVRVGSGMLANAFFTHEMVHARDHTRNKLSHPLRVRAGNIATFSWTAMGVGCFLVSKILQNDYNFEGFLGSDIDDRIYQGLFAAAAILYYLSPTEMRAYSLMFVKSRNILQISTHNSLSPTLT